MRPCQKILSGTTRGGKNTGLTRERGIRNASNGSTKKLINIVALIGMERIANIWMWILIIILYSYISFFDEWNNFFIFWK